MSMSCYDAGTSQVTRFEVFTGAGRRRDWPPEVKAVSAYATRIDELEREKLVLSEKVNKCGTPASDYCEIFQISLDFLSSPWIFIENGKLKDCRAMLKQVFGGSPRFKRGEGFLKP